MDVLDIARQKEIDCLTEAGDIDLDTVFSKAIYDVSAASALIIAKAKAVQGKGKKVDVEAVIPSVKAMFVSFAVLIYCLGLDTPTEEDVDEDLESIVEPEIQQDLVLSALSVQTILGNIALDYFTITGQGDEFDPIVDADRLTEAISMLCNICGLLDVSVEEVLKS